MKNTKNILLDDFNGKDFLKRKEILLEMLKNLNGYSDIVKKLGKTVFYVKEGAKGNKILEDIYKLIIDAIELTKNQKSKEKENKLEEIHNFLIKSSIQEKEERESEDLESYINKLNDL